MSGIFVNKQVINNMQSFPYVLMYSYASVLFIELLTIQGFNKFLKCHNVNTLQELLQKIFFIKPHLDFFC